MNKKVENKKLYNTLGVSPKASHHEIHQAYRSLSLQLHPDKLMHSKEIVSAREIESLLGQREKSAFDSVHNAYMILSDEYKRSVYDQFGLEGIDYLNSTSLIKRKLTLDQIRRKLRRLNDVSKLEWFDKTVAFRGVTQLSLRADSFIDIQKGYPFRDVADVSLTQSYDFISAEKGKLNFAYRNSKSRYVNLKDGVTITGTLYSVNDLNLDLFSSLRFSDAPSLTIGGNAVIDEFTSGSQSLIFEFNKGLKLKMKAQRKLFVPYIAPPAQKTGNKMDTCSPSLFGSLKYVSPGKLILGWNYYSGNSLTQASKVIIGANNLISIRNRFEIFISRLKDTWLDFSFNLNLKELLTRNWNISISVFNLINKISNIGLGINMDFLFGISLVYQFVRMKQRVIIPILISEFLSLTSFITALSIQISLYLVLHVAVLAPYRNRKKLRKLESRQESIKQKKEEAEMWVQQMQNSYNINYNEEKNLRRGGGLVIRHACYGNIGKRSNFAPPGQQSRMWYLDIPPEEEGDNEIIDVTKAVQLLVSNSRLHLPQSISKSSFNGIYDPSPGSENYIELFYEFQNRKHRVVTLDHDELIIPQLSHQI